MQQCTMTNDDSITSELEINFEGCGHSITEGSTLLRPIEMQFRRNQNPFTLIFRAVSIATAEIMGLKVFFNNTQVDEPYRATPGTCISLTELDGAYFIVADVDFVNASVTVEVPPSAKVYGFETVHLPQFFTVFNDDVDEHMQTFAIVAEIGGDVPDGVGCFMINSTHPHCYGRRGAITIEIIDNNRKVSHLISFCY